jgi:hypothetical protein
MSTSNEDVVWRGPRVRMAVDVCSPICEVSPVNGRVTYVCIILMSLSLHSNFVLCRQSHVLTKYSQETVLNNRRNFYVRSLWGLLLLVLR